jgi:uncharacterized protein YjlB
MFNPRDVAQIRPELLKLAPNGRMPNSELPVVIYRQVINGDHLEAGYRRLFNDNGWFGDWAMGIYGYHHFHSNAHEVLGVAAGSASLVLGGEGGATVEVSKGDVVILPAGTGHRRIADSWDFWVVGAYPAGQESPDEFTDKRMRTNLGLRLRSVQLPRLDPVYGATGPLTQLWIRDTID